jgi:ATP-dependent DNA helicase RecQ
VALPTGFGKSLIYQVPAMILEHSTIVISPLIALMADQERALKKCGVPVIRPSQPAARGRAPRHA